MLIHELRELQQDKVLRYTNYPRLITSQILSDWVFTQYPVLLKDVIEIILNGINIGSIINQDSRYASNEPILLPNECGRTEIFNECFKQLKLFPKKDYAIELIGVIRNNPLDNENVWKREALNYSNNDLIKWLEYGHLLQIIYKLDTRFLGEIVMKDSLDYQERKIQILIQSNRFDVLEESRYLKETLLNGILKNYLFATARRKLESGIQFLSMLLNTYSLKNVLKSENENISFLEYLSQTLSSYSSSEKYFDFKVNDEIDLGIKKVADELKPILDRPVIEWKVALENWDSFVEVLRQHYGDTWIINAIAIISSGIKSKEEKYESFSELGNLHISLCKRTRCARMKSGNLSFWRTQLNFSKEINYKLCVYLTWATSKTIIEMYNVVSDLISKLSEEECLIIIRTLKSTAELSTFNSMQSSEMITFLKGSNSNEMFNYMISFRLSESTRDEFIYKEIGGESNLLSDEIYEVKFDYLVGEYFRNPNDIDLLNRIKEVYSALPNFSFHDYIFYRHYHENKVIIPYEISKNIMADAKSYPRIIASMAEKACRQYANREIIHVGKIANDEKWFD